MTLTELKQSLHQKIEASDDRELLEQLNIMVDRNEPVFVIPEHMKERIRQGLEDADNNHYHTWEEFQKNMSNGLKSKIYSQGLY